VKFCITEMNEDANDVCVLVHGAAVIQKYHLRRLFWVQTTIRTLHRQKQYFAINT